MANFPLQSNLMGGETSTLQSSPQHHPLREVPAEEEEEEDFFMLEPIANIPPPRSIIPAYFLIASAAAFPHEIIPELRKVLPRLEHFPEARTLRQELNFLGNNEMVRVIVSCQIEEEELEWLQGERRVERIVMVREEDPPVPLRKITPVKLWQSLPEVIQQMESKERGTVPSSTILLVDQDTKLLNKYRLNFHCATRFTGRRQAKYDFLTLARHLYPQDQSELFQFQHEYDLSLEGEAKRRMVLLWAFKEKGFFWRMIDNVTRNTTDPKRMAYVRLALKDLHEAVTLSYKTIPHYREAIYVVVDITEEQRQKLSKGHDRFLLFASFVKGYTFKLQKQANLQKKSRPHAFIFTIMPNCRPSEPSLDFGFAIAPHDPLFPLRPNVIVNIYNVMQVRAMAGNNRNGELQLNALGVNLKQRETSRGTMSEGELGLVRNYDYLEDMMGKIDGQATLLQLAGHLKDSLYLYDRKAEATRKVQDRQGKEKGKGEGKGLSNSQGAAQEGARWTILKGDALRRSGQFQAAQKQYSSVRGRMRLIALVHLAQLQLHRGEQVKFQRAVGELAAGAEGLKSEQEEFFRARNLFAIRMIKQGKFRTASTMLHKLVGDVRATSQHSFEGRPVVHDSYRCLATCLARDGDPKGAINLLKDTLNWQLSCEGKTPNVALTETLIQSVSRSANNHEELQRSMQRVKDMQAEMEREHGRGSVSESAFGNDLLRSLRAEKEEESKSAPASMTNLEGGTEGLLGQSQVRMDLTETLLKAEIS